MPPQQQQLNLDWHRAPTELLPLTDAIRQLQSIAQSHTDNPATASVLQLADWLSELHRRREQDHAVMVRAYTEADAVEAAESVGLTPPPLEDVQRLIVWLHSVRASAARVAAVVAVARHVADLSRCNHFSGDSLAAANALEELEHTVDALPPRP